MNNLKLKIKNFASCGKHGKLNSGFTLVETLVAISILTISILGTFTAVQKGLATSTFAKDQVTAFYIIQDAIEQIRNIRDTNGLESIYQQSIGGTSVSWLHGLAESAGDNCYFGKVCTVDSYTNQTATCASTCPNLKQDSTTGLFGYTSGWADTKFNRSISLTSIPTKPDEVVIVVTVSWSSGVFSKTITVRQSLFNMH